MKKNYAASIYDLAAQCGVSISEACDLAGIARSTPPRWKSGTKPRPQQLAKLNRAITMIARRNGTLPESLTATTDQNATLVPGLEALVDVWTIVAAARRLEKRFIEEGGDSLAAMVAAGIATEL